MTEARKFTAAQKARVLAREVSYRVFVYPKRVANGKMTKAQADEQIGIMAEIRDEYQRLADEEAEKGRLPL